ncbi:MAG: hypothetical protein K6L74_14315 [Neptuniibacter sp.]
MLLISFAVCAYVALFHVASKHRDDALSAIIVLALTAIGLSAVNVSDAQAAVLKEGQSTLPYWFQTGAISAYVVTLIVLYLKDGKRS